MILSNIIYNTLLQTEKSGAKTAKKLACIFFQYNIFSITLR